MFGKKNQPQPTNPDLRCVKQQVGALEKRADRVVPALIARRARNHWGETIAAIARGEQH